MILKMVGILLNIKISSMKKRVIKTLSDFEFELNMLPDPESERDIIVSPKSELDYFFMEKALDHNIDDAMLDEF